MSGYYAVLGSDTSSGASFLRQSFAIPVGVDQLAVSFSYTFAGSDTAPFQADTALAALKQSFWFFSTANELLEASSPGDYSSGTYYGVVNVANWFGIDATTGELIFSLYESSPGLGSTNSLFAVDNVSVAAVPEPTTMLLLGLGLVPIPLIPPCDSEGSRHPVPGEAATPSERSDAGDFSSFS